MYNYQAPVPAPALPHSPAGGQHYPNTGSLGYAHAAYTAQTYGYPASYDSPGPSTPSQHYGYTSLNGHSRGPMDGGYGTPPAAPPNRYGYAPQQPYPNTPSSYGYSAPPPQQPAPPVSNVTSIPAPSQPTTYQAPVFKTFQERKHEREAAIRAAAAAQSEASTPPSSHEPTPAPSPYTSRMAPTPPSLSGHGMPRYGGPSAPSGPAAINGLPGQRSPSTPQFSTPPPAALAMMGQHNGARPTPPPRSSSGPVQSPVRGPLPSPRGVTSPVSPISPWGATPPPNAAGPPGPRTASQPPASPRRNTADVPVIAPHRVPSPGPAPAAAVAPSPVSPPASLTPSIRNKAVAALLDRSDTVSSVKSVDRPGFGANRRSLPRPPPAGGLAASKSLDRGPAMPGNPRMQRRDHLPVRMSAIPAIPGIAEVPESAEELAARLSNVSVGGIVPSRSPSTSPDKQPVELPQSNASTRGFPGQQSPVVPTISVGPPPVPSISVGSPSIPTINVGGPAVPTINIGGPSSPPAITIGVPDISVSDDSSTTPPVPTIKLSDDDTPRSRPASPNGFAFSGLPTIAVESGDTRDVAGGVSITVPSVHPPSNSRHSSRSSTRPSNHNHYAAPSRIHPNSAILCAGCDNPIIGRIVSAMKQRWHPQCFTCGTCGELLEHVSSYEHEGKPYCHLDYHDRFAHRCHHCQTPIVDARFVTLNDDVLGERYYHELHFFCSECGDPFLDPSMSSAAGTEVNGDHEANETNAFVIHKGHPYCERCHLRLHKPKCHECCNPIPDVAVSAMGAKYHRECFVCKRCTRPFANSLFFPVKGQAFCTECFEAMQ